METSSEQDVMDSNKISGANLKPKPSIFLLFLTFVIICLNFVICFLLESLKPFQGWLIFVGLIFFKVIIVPLLLVLLMQIFKRFRNLRSKTRIFFCTSIINLFFIAYQLVHLIINNPNLDPIRRQIGTYKNYINIQGKIIDNVYYDPNGRFSIKVPTLMQPGAVIKDGYQNVSGTVSFEDDFGKFIRVDVTTAVNPMILTQIKNKEWERLLNDYRVFMVQQYQKYIPETKLVHQEFIKTNDMIVDYYICNTPRGSNLVNSKNNQRLNVCRSSLSFIQGESIYVITTMNNLECIMNDVIGEKKQDDKDIQRIKSELLGLKDTIKILK